MNASKFVKYVLLEITVNIFRKINYKKYLNLGQKETPGGKWSAGFTQFVCPAAHHSAGHFHVDQCHWLFTLSNQCCRLSNGPFRFLIDHVTMYGYYLFVSKKHHALAYTNPSYSPPVAHATHSPVVTVLRHSRAILPERVQRLPILERVVTDFHNGATRLKSRMAFPTFHSIPGSISKPIKGKAE